MNKSLLLPVLLILLAAGIATTSCEPESQTASQAPVIVEEPALQALMKGARGVLIMMDAGADTIEVSDTRLLDQGHLPASTFKIPNTLIGLETGSITPTEMFAWDGTDHWNDAWEHDLSLREAFRTSCVPCYQDLARRIGTQRMKDGLLQLRYPGMEVTDSTLDQFWLRGSSRITPMQQLDLLRRLHGRSIPLQSTTYDAFETIFAIDTVHGGMLFGKTGTAWSDADPTATAWFVGWWRSTGRTRFLVILLEPPTTMPLVQMVEERMELVRAMIKL